MKHTLVIITLFILFSCSEKQPEQESLNIEKSTIQQSKELNVIESLSWMEGVWIDTSAFSFMIPPVKLMEVWKVYPDSISGVGYSIEEGDTSISKQLLIREVNGKVNYVVRPIGKPIIVFPLENVSDKDVSFQNNAHDFPQKINYAMLSETAMYVIWSGIIPQGERKVTLKMSRVSI